MARVEGILASLPQEVWAKMRVRGSSHGLARVLAWPDAGYGVATIAVGPDVDLLDEYELRAVLIEQVAKIRFGAHKTRRRLVLAVCVVVSLVCLPLLSAGSVWAWSAVTGAAAFAVAGGPLWTRLNEWRADRQVARWGYAPGLCSALTTLAEQGAYHLTPSHARLSRRISVLRASAPDFQRRHTIPHRDLDRRHLI